MKMSSKRNASIPNYYTEHQKDQTEQSDLLDLKYRERLPAHTLALPEPEWQPVRSVHGIGKGTTLQREVTPGSFVSISDDSINAGMASGDSCGETKVTSD